jgi:hypothetical protein
MAYQVAAANAPAPPVVNAINGNHEDRDFSMLAHYDSTEISVLGVELYIDSPAPVDFLTAVTVLNQAKLIYNQHDTYSNGGSGVPLFAHKNLDGRIVTVAAMDGSVLYSTIFNSIKTLYLAIRPSYVAHIANSPGAYHTAPDTVDVLGAVPVIVDEADLAVDMNNLKAQYNLHLINVTAVHGTADVTNGITAANAVQGDLTSFITLVNQMKPKLNAHFALGATTHPGGADTDHTITAAAVTLPAGLFDLVNDIHDKYEAHRVDATVAHNIADVTNILNALLYPVANLTMLVAAAADIQTKLNAHFRYAPPYSRALRVIG